MAVKQGLIQLQNPVTKKWVVIDKGTGKIIKHSRTKYPYRNISVIPCSKGWSK